MQQQRSNCNNVLCIYSSSQTYTSTVFEHLYAFKQYSKLSWSYLDIGSFNANLVNIHAYDALVIHYSVRLPFDQIGDLALKNLRNFNGAKILFIQDEYDNTNKVKKIINEIPFELVFSVVPDKSIKKSTLQVNFFKPNLLIILLAMSQMVCFISSDSSRHPLNVPLSLHIEVGLCLLGMEVLVKKRSRLDNM